MKNTLLAIIAVFLVALSHQEVFAHESETTEGAVYGCILKWADRDQDGQISGDSWNETEKLCREMYPVYLEE